MAKRHKGMWGEFEILMWLIHRSDLYLSKKEADSDEYFIERKREFRRWWKTPTRRVHFSENGESCWFKEFIPERLTDEEKKNYIEENWVEINSPYDCTGLWFTTRIVLCNTKGGCWVYHFKSIDV